MMNELNEGTQLETTVTNMQDMVDIKVLEDMDFLKVIQCVGKERVVHLLNAQLDSARYEVKLGAEDIEKRIIEKDDYEELGLFYHSIVFPRFPESDAISKRINKALRETIDVGVYSEDDFTRTYLVELSKSPIVNTMSEIVSSITCVLWPEVEGIMKKYKLNEYHMIFNLELGV